MSINNKKLIDLEGLETFKEGIDDLLGDKQNNLTSTSVPDGTLSKFIGFDSNGNLKKGSPQAITVDNTLSSTSTNPVQNKVIKAALDNVINIISYQVALNILNGATLLPEGTTVNNHNISVPSSVTISNHNINL